MARSTRPRRNRLVREAPEAGYKAAPEQGLTGVLYDSDVIIEILRRRSRVVEAATVLEGGGVPTYCTGRVGRRAGAYLARYAKSHGVEIADALVAAAAVTSGLRLWTLDRKHYPMSDVSFYEV